MDEVNLKKRTKQFALRVMSLVRALPPRQEGRVIGNQILRSATSVGANYRAACRARSKADFVSKIRVVEEESDECAFWLELIIEDNLLESSRVLPLLEEANELTAIFAASQKTASRRLTERTCK